MFDKSFPEIGKTHATDMGVRVWHPRFRELRVCHLNNGNTVITFNESGQAPVVFEFDADQRDAFIDLLRNTPELAPTQAQQAQPATDAVAQRV